MQMPYRLTDRPVLSCVSRGFWMMLLPSTRNTNVNSLTALFGLFCRMPKLFECHRSDIATSLAIWPSIVLTNWWPSMYVLILVVFPHPSLCFRSNVCVILEGGRFPLITNIQ